MTTVHNINLFRDRRKTLRKNETKAEGKLWEYLRNSKFYNLKFKRQHSVKFYIADFYCKEKRLIIEVDGDSHFTENAKAYDKERTKFFGTFGLDVLRFTNEEVLKDTENVLRKIYEFAFLALPHLASSLP